MNFKEFVASGASDEEVDRWIRENTTQKDRKAIINWNNEMRRRKNTSKPNEDVKYELSPLEIINGILENPKDIENVRSLTTKDVTYVSLNYRNPDLKRIMPWCGTSLGPESIVKTFLYVGRFWKVKSFKKDGKRKQVLVTCASGT
jgi:Domain of unknown function (DUF5069)